MGIKPRSWSEADFRRQQLLDAMRQGFGVKKNENKIHESMRPKLESGRAWICGQCQTMQTDPVKCKNCGVMRFGGLFKNDKRIAEEQFRDMLRRRRF